MGQTMAAGGVETMERITLNLLGPLTSSSLIETEEKDPMILESPQTTLLVHGMEHTFTVKYRAHHEVVIALSAKKDDNTPFNGSPKVVYKKVSGGIHQCYFSFKIEQANSSLDNGTYTVRIWDPLLPARTGANPAEVSWRVVNLYEGSSF